MRGDRLISILLLLQTYGRMTAAQLAEKLEVSERTIYRDMDALSSAHFPVVSHRGKNGGWSLLKGYRTDLTGLKTEESLALFIAPSSHTLAQLGLKKPFLDAQQKLAAALPDPDVVREVKNRILIDSTPWQNKKRAHRFDALSILREAVWQNRKLKMRYRKADGTESIRIVEPLGLVVKGATWYFVARQERRIRSFRISRIAMLEQLEETFERPHSFDLESYWHESVRSFVRHLPQYVVKALVEASVIPRLTWGGRFIQDVQLGETLGETDRQHWVPVTLTFDTEQEALEFGLGLGDPVRKRNRSGLNLYENTLRLKQFGIMSPACQQFIVRSLFFDSIRGHDDDAVSMADCRQPVCDDQGSSALGQFVQCALDRRFRFRIEGGCGFIQNENRRIFQKHAGDRDPLFLAAGQFHPALTDDGVQPVGQRTDKRFQFGTADRFPNFFIGSIQFPVPDVVSQRTRKQEHILLNDSDLLAQRSQLDITNIMTVYRDRTGLNIVKTRQQAANRRFAGAGRTDKGHCFSRTNIQINAI